MPCVCLAIRKPFLYKCVWREGKKKTANASPVMGHRLVIIAADVWCLSSLNLSHVPSEPFSCPFRQGERERAGGELENLLQILIDLWSMLRVCI